MADSGAESVLGHLSRWLDARQTSQDDGRLLERFVLQRDEQAFAELMARHGPLVFGLCRRVLQNVQDAEDVFQATFLVLARKAATIHKPESLSCWLHGVAYRLALKAKAETQRRRFHEREAVSVRNSDEDDLSWREMRGVIDEELQRLPEKQRLPLVLCYLEGLTQDEAARRLNWPRGTLKRRLESGREKLRLRLTQRGISLGTGRLPRYGRVRRRLFSRCSLRSCGHAAPWKSFCIAQRLRLKNCCGRWPRVRPNITSPGKQKPPYAVWMR
jgi:RNA polymerase sigma factor (sigma-70 family)